MATDRCNIEGWSWMAAPLRAMGYIIDARYSFGDPTAAAVKPVPPRSENVFLRYKELLAGGSDLTNLWIITVRADE